MLIFFVSLYFKTIYCFTKKIIMRKVFLSFGFLIGLLIPSYAQNLTGSDIIAMPFSEVYDVSGGRHKQWSITPTHYASLSQSYLKGDAVLTGLIAPRQIVLTAWGDFLAGGGSTGSVVPYRFEKLITILKMEMEMTHWYPNTTVVVGKPSFVTLKCFPSGATIEWTYSNNLLMDINHGKGDADFIGLSVGSAWIQAKVTRGSQTEIFRKEFNVSLGGKMAELKSGHNNESAPSFIRVYDMSGKLVLTEDNPEYFNINTTILKNGTYVIVTKSSDGSLQSNKVMKK